MATASTSLERPMPHNVEAERSILGAILLDNNAINPAIEKLKPEDFFHDHHRRIYQQMIALGETSQAIDLVTLTEQLQRTGELEAVGGAAYVSQLMDGVPHITNVEHYAAHREGESAVARPDPCGQRDPAAGHRSRRRRRRNPRPRRIFHFSACRRSRATGPGGITRCGHRKPRPNFKIYEGGHRITGLSTGYDMLDNLTSGLQPSELIILAARPSMGKTAFALNLAENVGVRGNKPVAIFSLEMSKESLLLRLLSADAKIDSHKFRTGHLNQEDKARIPESLGHLSAAPALDRRRGFRDGRGNGREAAANEAREGTFPGDRGLFAAGLRARKIRKPQRRNCQHHARAQGLAKELKVPMLVLSQLTRAPEREDREPRLADLRESGAIEQDADVVMFIHRPNFFKKSSEVSMEERGETDLIIAKQRNGPTDTIRFVFQGSFTRFEQRAPDAWTETESVLSRTQVCRSGTFSLPIHPRSRPPMPHIPYRIFEIA